MISCSKQLVFSAENLKNPASAGILFGDERPGVISAEYGGSMTLSVGVVRLPSNKEQMIRNIFAGVAENYSYVRKSYNPINTIRFFGSMKSDLGSIIGTLDSAFIGTTNLKFNGSAVADMDAARALQLKDSQVDRIAENKLEFDHDPATLSLPYAPRFLRSGGCIFDSLSYLGGLSFIDTASPDFSILIPKNLQYLLLFLSSAAPTPISQFRPTASNLSVSANVAFDLVEV